MGLVNLENAALSTGKCLDPVDARANPSADKSSPRQTALVLSNGEPRMSDKLFIDLWGLTISADGVYAIGAAVVIVLVVTLVARLRF
jgi:hypothetical protein